MSIRDFFFGHKGVTITPVEKRPQFGLKEAEAASAFTRNPDQAQAVMAVVVGVLGYENTVAADVEAEATEQQLRVAGFSSQIENREEQIASLQAQITTLAVRIDESKAREAAVRTVGQIFASR